MHSLKIPDINQLIINYLYTSELIPYFLKHNLSLQTKFTFNATHIDYKLTKIISQTTYILARFPNIILKGTIIDATTTTTTTTTTTNLTHLTLATSTTTFQSYPPYLLREHKHIIDQIKLSRPQRYYNTQYIPNPPITLISTLPSTLIYLDLSACHNISNISPISQCPLLTHLNLSHCFSIKSLDVLSHTPKLTYLNLLFAIAEPPPHIPKLRTLLLHSLRLPTNPYSYHSLRTLELTTCPIIHPIIPLINTLIIHDAMHLHDISPITNCPHIHTLKLFRAYTLKNINSLNSCVKLQTLEIIGNNQIVTLPNLSACTKLHTLKLCKCSALTSINAISNMPSLRTLLATYSRIKMLPPCPTLQFIDCTNSLNLGSPLPEYPLLESLTITQSLVLTNIDTLAKSPHLTYLDLNSTMNLSSIDSLQFCPKLLHLNISRSGRVHDIFALKFCSKLQTINLSYCYKWLHWDPLSYCNNLHTIIASKSKYSKSVCLDRLNINNATIQFIE